MGLLSPCVMAQKVRIDYLLFCIDRYKKRSKQIMIIPQNNHIKFRIDGKKSINEDARYEGMNISARCSRKISSDCMQTPGWRIIDGGVEDY